MTRSRTFLSILIPAALAGGLLTLQASATRADDDDAEAEARAAEARAEEAMREAEAARARAHAKTARKAEKQARKAARDGVRAARDGVRGQLDAAREQIRHAPIPEELREKILERLEQVGASIEQHLSNADTDDLEQLEREMEAMGEELEREMEQLGEELGEHFGERFAQGFDQDFDFDVDPQVFVVPPVPPVPPGTPVPPAVPSGRTAIDMSDMDISIDPGALGLEPDQVDALHAIFEAEQAVTGPGRAAIEQLSDELREALDRGADEAEVGRMVDALSAEEAKVRKAEILAWVKSRKLLDDDQRVKVQRAHGKRGARSKVRVYRSR